MAYEDIEIRIARDGTVYVHVDGVSEERIQNIRHFLEEEIGPLKSMEIIRKPDWDQPATRTIDEEAGRETELGHND